MFELLLQADKSLADGALAQAERTYWQLVDLDPSNAIAFSGLARVALARGDERLARGFADRALDLDPESVTPRAWPPGTCWKSWSTADPHLLPPSPTPRR